MKKDPAAELMGLQSILLLLEDMYPVAHREAGGEIYKAETALEALIVKMKAVSTRSA